MAVWSGRRIPRSSVWLASVALLAGCASSQADAVSTIGAQPASTSASTTVAPDTSPATTSTPTTASVPPVTTTFPGSTTTTTIPPTTTTSQPTPQEPERSTLGDLAFADSGQRLGDSRTYAVALGDLDGDRDLDAVFANPGVSQAWLNDGAARFAPVGQQLGSMFGLDVADLDLDGDLDVIAVGMYTRALFNDGSGRFAEVVVDRQECSGVALGDLDGDGDVDAFVTRSEHPNQVWRNDGSGGFEQTGQLIGGSGGVAEYSLDVELADLDGDSDLDVFEVNYNGLHRVWLNDGTGVFEGSGQVLEVGEHSHGVALSDLDGDGEVDVFVSVTGTVALQVWQNDGTGTLSVTAQDVPAAAAAQAVALGDLDGDGDLDAFMAHTGSSDDGYGNTVWLNDGTGVFDDSGLRLGHAYSLDVALGDLDGDGDLDALVANANFQNPVDVSNRVWLNVP